MAFGVLRVSAVVGVAASAAACGLIPDFDSRYGPGPTIAAADVTTKLGRQDDVMDTLAGFARHRDPALGGAALWYEATLLGFNYVDEECAEYLRLNFRLTRMQKRDKGMLDLMSKNTSGLLAAARVADPTITTVAAAFGLGAQLTDAWLDGYLFKMEPELVFRTVTKLQTGYRIQIDKKKAEITSAGNAYRVVQSYYTLCFPQTIEAKMSEFLSQSVADADATGAGKPAPGPVGAVDAGLTTKKQ